MTMIPEETSITTTTSTKFPTTTHDKDNPKTTPKLVPIGIHGVRLKRFEEVVAKLLASVEPRYVKLPPPPKEWIGAAGTTYEKSNNYDWLFSRLPSSARVVGKNHRLSDLYTVRKNTKKNRTTKNADT